MRAGTITFGQKLILSYLAFVLIPVVLIGTYAYTSTLRSVKEQFSAGIRGTLRQMKDNVAYTLEDLKRVSELLYYDQKLQQYLRSYEEGWYSYEATTNYLKPKLLGTMKSTGSPIWLSVYVASNTLPEIYYVGDPDADPLRTKVGQFELYHLDRLADRPWYKELPEAKEQPDASLYWRQIETDAAFRNISLVRRLNDEYRLDQLGLIRITLKIGDLFKTIDAQIGEASYIAVRNEKRELMYASGQPYPPPDNGGSADDYFSVEETVPGLGWTIAAYVPNRLIESGALKVRSLTLFVCFVSFLFLALLGIVVSRFFASRVTKVVSVLDAFGEGDFMKRTAYSGNDEFARIFRALNEMGDHTDKLIREVYVANLRKREAELEALQAQINPHFLYNTLSSISRLAKFGEIGKLHEMVMALAQFYRLTLSDGRTIIPIEDEWQQARAYIDIQRIKHKDKLDFSFRMDESIFEFDTIKLILQPFIENVLEHSWYGVDRIHLKIWGYPQNEAIVFQIIDDGIGMPRGRVDDIFDPTGIKAGYGIRNVHERIKLQFGEPYGVSICSGHGIGTSVKIVVPKFRSG
ncbi:cache domain-containing sensor histidine kinase [Paenibacillus ginsengarvi]|uniref:Sensor histidine kinase n=1 Tax=Paenibacillus ginsengarvi TaxID=400777 RepID=A0A3B0CMK8_9BACL|nr:sensor histidine kinase [Paenibacillus ginsengarvi]RKN86190.1 sensor histidine kinase [Paenibacillus ginsengarvi]